MSGPFTPAGSDRLLLMRHPETVGNALKQYVGSIESPLSDRGEEQCARAISALIAAAPDRIVTSPRLRCLRIASAVAESLDVPLTVDERIREMDFGPIEGMTYDEIQAAGIRMTWDAEMATHPLDGAESFAGFAARLGEARHDLERAEGTTAVVCHGGVIRRLTMAWLDIPSSSMWKLRVENVSTSIISLIEGTPLLEKWGLTPEELTRLHR